MSVSNEQRELWVSLYGEPGTTQEYCWDINGVKYGSDAEISHEVTAQLFETLGIGNANCKTLTLSIIADDIPKAAIISRYTRLANGNIATEWVPKGKFIANRRSCDDGIWNIEAYDYMRKAEVEWIPSDDLIFPMSMKSAADTIAALMGVEIDTRTKLTDIYTVDYPANEYTLRDILRFIAAAHGGNWIMTDENTLLLVKLFDMPEETHYLVDENGGPITFGGDRILVY